jgi:phosphatidylglycerophosphatase A
VPTTAASCGTRWSRSGWCCCSPPPLLWQAVAVGLFRFFDIVKPPPVRWADRSFKGGFGVMFDDIVAAGYTLLVLAILVNLLGS